MADIPSPEQFMAQQNDAETAQPATAQSPNNAAGNAPSPEQFMQQEKPMAERIFGEGVRPDATMGERALVTAEQATGAAAFSVAMQRVMQKMALRHGAAAMTGVGATPLVQGSLLAMDAFELAKMTAVGGAVGSLIEQGAANLGAGRGTQVALGAVLPGVAPTMARVGQGVMEAAGPTLGKLVNAGTYALGPAGYKLRAIGYGLKGAGEEQLRKGAVEAERAALLSATKPEAATVAGQALEKGVAEQTSRFRTAQELKQARIAGLISKEEAVKAEAALAKEQAQPGIMPETTPAKLGEEMQTSVTKAAEPLLTERAEGYKKLYNEALQSARVKERSGEHFGASEEGAKIKEVLNQKIRGTGEPTSDYTPDQKAQFSKLKEQIFGRKGAVDPITGEKLPDIKPASARQLDTLVRRLGDAAFGKEAEGAKAIDSQVAKDTRDLILKGADGNGGIYTWEPKFAEAKQFYRAKSEELGPWSTKRGQAVTSKEDFVGVLKNRFAMEPDKVAQQYFSSSRGFDDLTNQLGGNAKQATKFGEEYAMQKLEGLGSDKAEAWLKKQSWLEDSKAKSLRDKLETYVFEQRQKEGRAASLEEKAKSSKVVSEDHKSFLQNIDEKVAAHQTALEKKFGIGAPESSRIEDVISGKMTTKDINEFRSVLRSSPEARDAMPDIALQYIVKGDKADTIIGRAEQVLHNLQRAKMLTPKQATEIMDSANKFAEVTKGSINNRKQLDSWTTHFAKRLNGAVSRTVGSAAVGKLNEGKE